LEQLTENERIIMSSWLFRTRYLQPVLWRQLKHLIFTHKITSVLEFGSGLSTLLFDSLNLKVLSYETDPEYLSKFYKKCSSNVTFVIWNNEKADIWETFGLSLVDGILPRTNQLIYAMAHSRYIAIDDFLDEETSTPLLPLLEGWTRIDSQQSKLAVFRRFR
jgi:hypothetical protein